MSSLLRFKCSSNRRAPKPNALLPLTMHKLVLPILFLLCFTACKRSKFESDFERISYDGERRTYLLHVPSSYNGDESVALVIALHGGTGSAKNIEEQSGLPSLSNEKGFILCSPNGLNNTWNAGNCCGKAEEKKVDDVGFINALIEELEANYAIDPRRIYVTGMSNGAMMSYRLACELGDRIAAIAPVAGTMVFDCVPAEPVSIIHFHSYEDSNVPWNGGVGDGISDHYNPPLDSMLNAWVGFNSCIELSSEQTDDYDMIEWLGCDAATDIMLYLSHDGAHSWPMGTKPRKKADDPSQALDANALMWEFFESHSKEE